MVMEHIRKAGALIISKRCLLIVRPHNKSFFINPRGKYEQGETTTQCLKRELQEELKINLKAYKHYKTYRIAKAVHHQNPLILELYLVDYSGEIKPSSEVECVEWMSKEDFYNKKFNIAPSFYEFVPDLMNDRLL